MYCKSISYILALTVNVYYIYWHWLLTVTTDYWSRIPVGASSSHRVCSPSAPSRRPTPPSNFSLSAMYRFLFCTYLYPQWVVLTSYFAFYYIFCGTSPFISLYICNIVYISTVLSTDLFLFSYSYLRKCEYHRLLYWSSCWSLWFLLKRSSC